MNKFFHEIKEFLVFFRHLYVLRKTYKQFKPDVIFLQTLLYPSYLAYFLPRITPVIITFWNGDILWWAQWNGIERKFKKQIVQYGIKRATTITVNSNSAYEICLNYGIDKKSVHIIRYPGIDLELFKEYDKEQCRKKIQVLTKHIVFWPRGIGSYLNFDTLLNAIPYVINQISDITFLVFPNNQLSINIIEKIESMGIESFIDFRNNVRFDEMPMYYSASDVMVSISSNDSQPNTMLEAMGCGCPVIMGDLPQIREWISEGSNGFIVDTDNPIALAGAIINVLTLDHEFLQKMKSQNRILIESKVDSKKMKEEIKRVVNSTVYGFESKNGHYNVT